ncbi:PREDICTED: myosin-M heavy chain-like isoform X2 [Camelina sativa]|uniref:Myosin-M heavy chain-like isoform X2 n=1 Tax=Camelina sativa TaxID=90675 RepID=A0ABM0TIX0_CAMSA|nr:PREDICTED: myosin-M heavy chain-like isoform X2 [Camelina sativa]
MGKSSRSKGSRIIGKGEVTPTQIAFIVDRYLFDNRFTETRTLFRSEASSLISNSPLRHVPNSLMTLDDMLNDYVSLKEQKVTIDQERVRLDQEKVRVHNLLQGMQNVMNSYNASLTAPPPPPPPPPATEAPASLQKNQTISSSSGLTQYNKTPNVMSVSLLGNKRVDFGNFSTPSTTRSITGKRKAQASLGAPPVTRKARITTANGTNKITQTDKAANNFSSQTPSETVPLAKSSATTEFVGHGSSVVKCLFNKPDSLAPSNSACLTTPQKHASPGIDKSNSPQKEVNPTNCTIVTKEKFTISPLKQITSYSVERSHLISSSSPVKSNLKMSNKRDHVKGKLNFDNADTPMCLEAPATADLVSASPSGSEPEVDLFDMDFSNFLGENYSLSELLVDFDLGCEGGTNHCLPQASNAPIETVSGSSPESGGVNLESDQAFLEYTSTVTEVTQGKDMNSQGNDAKTVANSLTQCNHISSPAKC